MSTLVPFMVPLNGKPQKSVTTAARSASVTILRYSLWDNTCSVVRPRSTTSSPGSNSSTRKTPGLPSPQILRLITGRPLRTRVLNLSSAILVDSILTRVRGERVKGEPDLPGRGSTFLDCLTKPGSPLFPSDSGAPDSNDRRTQTKANTAKSEGTTQPRIFRFLRFCRRIERGEIGSSGPVGLNRPRLPSAFGPSLLPLLPQNQVDSRHGFTNRHVQNESVLLKGVQHAGAISDTRSWFSPHSFERRGAQRVRPS